MGVIETIKKQEREEGILKGKIQMLKELGYSIAEICKKLTLTKTEVEQFLKGA